MFSCPFGLDVDGIVRVGDRLASINVAPDTMRVIPGIRILIASLVPTFVPQTQLLLHHLQPPLLNRLYTNRLSTILLKNARFAIALHC